MADQYDNPDGAAYELIGVGPVVTRKYETQERIGVDNSSKQARSLSPFRISFLAPDIYSNSRRLSDSERQELEDERRSVRQQNQSAQNEAELRQNLEDIKNWAGSLAGQTSADDNEPPPPLSSSGSGTGVRTNRPESDRDEQFTENFWRSDFKSKSDGWLPDEFVDNARAVAVEMEKLLSVLRQITNRPTQFFKIISTWRGPKDAKRKGKEYNPEGNHSQAKAFDFRFHPLNEFQLFQIAQSMMDGTAFTGTVAGRSSRGGGFDIGVRLKQGGLGIYPPSDSFVHYDLRGKRARWGPTGSRKSLPAFDPDEETLEELRNITSSGVTVSDQERQRALDEKGVSVGSPVLTRALANITLPPNYVSTYNAAGRSFNSFQDARAANQEGLLIGLRDLAGPLPNFVRSERFIVNGLEEQSRSGTGRYDDPTLVDRATAVDIATQLYEMRRAPPLTLMINPNNFSINYNQVQQFTERNKRGYIFQRWGEDQPTITFSGQIGAFMTGSRNGQAGDNAGLHWASKRDSVAFQNLMHLFTMYRNNGYVYDRINRTNAMHAVGSIVIEFDKWVYIGNFNSFDYGYAEEKPHGTLEFNCEFVVNRMFDTANSPTEPLDPMTSGTPNPITPPPGGAFFNPVAGTGGLGVEEPPLPNAEQSLADSFVDLVGQTVSDTEGLVDNWAIRLGRNTPKNKNKDIPKNDQGVIYVES